MKKEEAGVAREARGKPRECVGPLTRSYFSLNLYYSTTQSVVG